MTDDYADEQGPERPERRGEKADPPTPAGVAAEIRDCGDGERDADQAQGKAEIPRDVLAQTDSDCTVGEHRQGPKERPAEDCSAARVHPVHIDGDDESERAERGGYEPRPQLRPA